MLLCIGCLRSENKFLHEYAAIVLSSACDRAEKAEVLVSCPGLFETIYMHISMQNSAPEPVLSLLGAIFKESTSSVTKMGLKDIFTRDGMRIVGLLRILMHNERTSASSKLLTAKWY